MLMKSVDPDRIDNPHEAQIVVKIEERCVDCNHPFLFRSFVPRGPQVSYLLIAETDWCPVCTEQNNPNHKTGYEQIAWKPGAEPPSDPKKVEVRWYVTDSFGTRGLVNAIGRYLHGQWSHVDEFDNLYALEAVEDWRDLNASKGKSYAVMRVYGDVEPGITGVFDNPGDQLTEARKQYAEDTSDCRDGLYSLIVDWRTKDIEICGWTGVELDTQEIDQCT